MADERKILFEKGNYITVRFNYCGKHARAIGKIDEDVYDGDKNVTASIILDAENTISHNSTLGLHNNDVELSSESEIEELISQNKLQTTAFWEDVVVNDSYNTYDKFVDMIKNYYAPYDDKKAYEIENFVNAKLFEMFKALNEMFGEK